MAMNVPHVHGRENEADEQLIMDEDEQKDQMEE